jgi:hypothetical protein
MAYETFERQSASSGDPALTVAPAPDSRITLNAAAARLMERAGVKAVRILWDKTKSGIALQSAQKGDHNSYSLVFGRHSRQAAFSGKAFLRYIGWSSSHRETVPAKWDEQQKMLEATLPSRFIGKREKNAVKRESSMGE